MRVNLDQPRPSDGRIASAEELIRHRRDREAQIVTLLTQGPKSVDDLFRLIYSGGPNERMSHLARDQIRSSPHQAGA